MLWFKRKKINVKYIGIKIIIIIFNNFLCLITVFYKLFRPNFQTNNVVLSSLASGTTIAYNLIIENFC